MNAQAIKTVTRLIGLILATYGYEVRGRNSNWHWRSKGGESETFPTQLSAVLSACEALITGQDIKAS